MSHAAPRAVQAIVLAVFAAALAVASLVQNAQQQPATETRTEQGPAHAEWTSELAARWPGCIDQDDYRGPQHFIPATVLVQPFANPTAPVRTMSLDEALDRNDTPSPRDDMWVVASCRGDIR